MHEFVALLALAGGVDAAFEIDPIHQMAQANENLNSNMTDRQIERIHAATQASPEGRDRILTRNQIIQNIERLEDGEFLIVASAGFFDRLLGLLGGNMKTETSPKIVSSGEKELLEVTLEHIQYVVRTGDGWATTGPNGWARVLRALRQRRKNYKVNIGVLLQNRETLVLFDRLIDELFDEAKETTGSEYFDDVKNWKEMAAILQQRLGEIKTVDDNLVAPKVGTKDKMQQTVFEDVEMRAPLPVLLEEIEIVERPEMQELALDSIAQEVLTESDVEDNDELVALFQEVLGDIKNNNIVLTTADGKKASWDKESMRRVLLFVRDCIEILNEIPEGILDKSAKKMPFTIKSIQAYGKIAHGKIKVAIKPHEANKKESFEVGSNGVTDKSELRDTIIHEAVGHNLTFMPSSERPGDFALSVSDWQRIAHILGGERLARLFTRDFIERNVSKLNELGSASKEFVAVSEAIAYSLTGHEKTRGKMNEIRSILSENLLVDNEGIYWEFNKNGNKKWTQTEKEGRKTIIEENLLAASVMIRYLKYFLKGGLAFGPTAIPSGVPIEIAYEPLRNSMEALIGIISHDRVFWEDYNTLWWKTIKQAQSQLGPAPAEKGRQEYFISLARKMEEILAIDAEGNVSCGTICKKDHEDSYHALDNQLTRQFDRFRAALGIAGDVELSEEETDQALVRLGHIDSVKQLQEARSRIRREASIPDNIKIFFSIPERDTELFWVNGDFAAGHFNKASTRMHISLPFITNRGTEAGIGVAQHELAHIEGKGHLPVKSFLGNVINAARVNDLSKTYDILESRQAQTVEALAAAEGRGIPIRTLVVVEAVGDKGLKDLEERLNEGLYRNGFGTNQPGSRRGKTTHELLLVSGKKDHESDLEFEERLKHEIDMARGYLPKEVQNMDRVVTVFAPLNVSSVIRNHVTKKHGKTVSVINDAYSDSSVDKTGRLYPDAMLRYAIAKHIFASTISQSLREGALKTINSLLQKITENSITIDTIEKLFAIDFILRIKPVDWNEEIDKWQVSQEAVATSL